MDREEGASNQNVTLFSHKKETNPSFCNNIMELEGSVLSEIRQAVKDKYQTISLICGV